MAIGPLRAGELRHIIAIRRNLLVDDGRGGQSRKWVDWKKPRAKVEALDGKEVMLASALQGVSAFRITMRWRNDVVQSDQIRLYTGVDLNIRSIIDPDGRRYRIEILADTGSADTAA